MTLHPDAGPPQPSRGSTLLNSILLAVIAIALLGIATALFLSILQDPAQPPPGNQTAQTTTLTAPGLQPALPIRPTISAQPQTIKLGTARQPDSPDQPGITLTAPVSLISPNATVRYVNARIESPRNPSEFRLESNTCIQTASQPAATACHITLRWNPGEPGNLADTFLVIDARPPDPLPGQPATANWQTFSHYVPVSGTLEPAPQPLEVELEPFRFPAVSPGNTHRLSRNLEMFSRPVQILSVRRDADTVATQDTLDLSSDCVGNHTPLPPDPAWCELTLLWSPNERTPTVNAKIHVDYAETPSTPGAPAPPRKRLTAAVTSPVPTAAKPTEPTEATLKWSTDAVNFGTLPHNSDPVSQRLRLIAGPAPIRIHARPILFASTSSLAAGITIHADSCLSPGVLPARYDCPMRIDWSPSVAIDARVILRWSADDPDTPPRELELPIRGSMAPPQPEPAHEPDISGTTSGFTLGQPPVETETAAPVPGGTPADITPPADNAPEPSVIQDPQDDSALDPLPPADDTTADPGLPQDNASTSVISPDPESQIEVRVSIPDAPPQLAETRTAPQIRIITPAQLPDPAITAARHDLLTRRALPVLAGPGAIIVPADTDDSDSAPEWTQPDYTSIGLEQPPGLSSRPVPLTTAVLAGTPIPAVLSLTVDSRQPTPVTAIVERDVHASHGRALIIPRGSRLIGRTTSLNPNGNTAQNVASNYDTALQGRLQIHWDRLVRPDGAAFAPSAELRTTDLMGRPGLPGRVNRRELTFFLTALSNVALQAGSTALLATDVTRIATAGQDGTVDLPGNISANTTPGNDNTPPTTSYAARISPLQLARHQARQAMLDVLRTQLAAALPPPPAVTVPAGTRMVVVPAIDLWLSPATPQTRNPAIPQSAEESPATPPASLSTSIPLTPAEKNPDQQAQGTQPAGTARPYTPPQALQDPYRQGYEDLFDEQIEQDALLDDAADDAAIQEQQQFHVRDTDTPGSSVQPTLNPPVPPDRQTIWR